MSTENRVLPRRGDIVLTRKGHRRLWDGRHWRVLCRISSCTAQRQGSLENKFGLCKRHFTQLESRILLAKNEHWKTISDEEKLKTFKRQKLNLIIDQLRYFQRIKAMNIL